MNTENSILEPKETNENSDLGVEPVPELEEAVSVKRVENYTYRGGTAFVGFTQALKLTGTSRATLHRYTQNGKLSFETDEDGHKIYQVIELERVFGKLKSPETEKPVSNEDERNQLETPDQDPETVLEMALLKAENERLRDKLEAEQQKAQLLAQSADDWKEQCQRMTLMLTHRPEPATAPEPTTAPQRRGLLRRILFGNGSQ